MKTIHVDISSILLLFDLIVKDCFGKDIVRGDFYCGITNNLERRAEQHNATFLGSVRCDSKETAIEVETFLGDAGYDIGGKAGNGARDNSIHVYVYKKTPETIEKVLGDE